MSQRCRQFRTFQFYGQKDCSNPEKETGVTTFFLDDNVDTGEIIFTEKTIIKHEDDAGKLHDRLKFIGSEKYLLLL